MPAQWHSAARDRISCHDADLLSNSFFSKMSTSDSLAKIRRISANDKPIPASQRPTVRTGVVARVSEQVLDDLVHWGDSAASSDHANRLLHVLSDIKLHEWSLHLNSIALDQLAEQPAFSEAQQSTTVGFSHLLIFPSGYDLTINSKNLSSVVLEVGV